MDAERWQRVDEVFAAALEQPAGQRRDFLDRACGDDAELRREVESLLANHGDEAFLASGGADEAMQMLVSGGHASPGGRRLGSNEITAPPGAGGMGEVDPDVDDSAGVRAGSYELLRRLGKGGMGVVYLALRADRDFKKHVAIKVIRKGMDSEEILARFRRERQILSSLDHPNIARLLDGGTTDDGRPYFVMEYIQGKPVIQYCDDHKLTVNERLKLFGDVCSAVRYAHQNLVVHRDLKPGNILVTAEGAVKLLDFGIAKLLNPEVSSVDLPPTATGIRLMTPEYASPEQARGDPVTTSTDVYSLGVILYELLVGRRPYQFTTRNFVDICRVITEEEPSRPSTAITGALSSGTDRPAAPRGVSPEDRKELRGDLDNIMLMALRKEPPRRYPSVEAFWEDIRRYLQGYPVQARQPTLRYRSAKYIGRHKVAVAAAAAVFILLTALSVLLALQNRRIAEQRNAAQRAEQKALQVTGFLVDLFETNDPARSKGEALTAREILDRGAQKLQREFQGSPELKAALLSKVGTLYDKLGSYDQAEALLRESLAARRAQHGDEHLATAESLHDLGVVLVSKAAYEEAEGLLREALAVRRALLGDAHPDVARSTGRLASIHMQNGQLDEAERRFREALAIWKRLGTEHQDVATDLSGLAIVLGRKGDSQQEEALFREALAMNRRVGNEHPDVAAGLSNLATVLWERGRLQDAEKLQREALALDRKLLGNEHPDLAVDLGNLAVTLRDQGQLDEAEKLQREALDIRLKRLGNAHPDVAFGYAGLAEVLLAKGQAQAAIELAGRALAFPEDRLPADSTTRARAKSVLGASLTAQRKYAQAEALLLDAYRVLSARSRAAPHTRTALQRIVRLYQAWGKPEKAAYYSALATGR